MKQTKFIEADSSDELTTKVQEAERAGWRYIGTSAAITPVSAGNAFMPASLGKLFLAAMQREQQLTHEEQG